jgi:hypothetical protein
VARVRTKLASGTGTRFEPDADYKRPSATSASTSTDQRPDPCPTCDHCAGVAVNRASTATGCRDLTRDGRVV